MHSRHSTSTLRGDKGQPTSLSSPFPVHRITEEGGDLDLVSQCGATPPTPSTPMTPPGHDSSGDQSVFATVMLPENGLSHLPLSLELPFINSFNIVVC